MQTVDYDPLDSLVRAGHQHLVAERFDEARKCFEEVLSRRPQHTDALNGMDVLEARGHSSPPIAPQSEEVIVGVAPSIETKIIELVKAKRYEEALDALFRAREARPEDAAVAKSIRHIKGHLERRYLRAIDLDAVPTIRQPPPHGDAAAVAAWIDGIGTYDDVIQVSPLGRFRTLRALYRMQRSGVVEATQPRALAPRRAPHAPAMAIPAPAIPIDTEPTLMLPRPSETEVAVAASLPSLHQPLRPRRRLVAPTLALVVLAAGGGWLAATNRGAGSEDPVPHVAAVPHVPHTSPAATPTEPPREVRAELQLDTTPNGARAYLGDRELGLTPLSIELSEHDVDDRVTIRFELEGHVSKTVERLFDGDAIAITTSLDRVESGDRVEGRERRRRRRARTAEARSELESAQESTALGRLRGYKAEPY